MKDDDCIFCKIVSEDAPSFKVYEDEHTIAFLDIKPTNPGHLLVVPKRHAKDIYHIDDADLCSVMHSVKKLSILIKDIANADGVNIIMNNSYEAGQRVFHLHVHIIPRFIDDGLDHWHGKPYPDGEIEKMQDKLIQAL